MAAGDVYFVAPWTKDTERTWIWSHSDSERRI